MGACFGCLKKGNSDADKDYAVETTTNPVSAVTCKIGLKGPGVTCSMDSATNIYSLSGSGMAIGSSSLDCDTAYWEVVAGANPAGLKIGIKRHNFKKKEPLGDGLLDGSKEGDCPSWILGEEPLVEGDVIGVHWDQTDLPMLSFTKNGVFLDKESVNRVRPAIDCVPAISLTNDASCQVIFDGNSFKQKANGSKFTMIMCATSLI
jgi:hypothetical protein